MHTEEIKKLEEERCECVLSIRGSYTCQRCKLLIFLLEEQKKEQKKAAA